MNDEEAEMRINELEEELRECTRLRECENAATARAIEAMREATADAKKAKDQADYFAGRLADIAEALGMLVEVPTSRMLGRIKELRKVEKNDKQGTVDNS